MPTDEGFSVKRKHALFSIAGYPGDTVYCIDLVRITNQPKPHPVYPNATTGLVEETQETGDIRIQDYGSMLRIGAFVPGVVEMSEGDTPKVWPNKCAHIADPVIAFEFVRMYLIEAMHAGWMIANNDMDR